LVVSMAIDVIFRGTESAGLMLEAREVV